MISSAEIRRSLTTKFVGQKIHAFDTVNSTNKVLKDLAATGALEGTIVIAEFQTAGRGRLNRTWHAERGKNILLSILLRPQEAEAVHLLTYLTALSAADAVEENTGLRVECKWPNDLLLNRRKFSGILLESSWKESILEYVIIGIAMNINEEQFPDYLRSTATSLRLECGKEFDRVQVLQAFLQKLESRYLESKASGFSAILERWARRCTIFGKEITVEQEGKNLSGTALRLDLDGSLVLLSNGREIKLYAGDVTVLGCKD